MQSNSLLIYNASVVNENRIFKGSVLVENNIIEEIFVHDVPASLMESCNVIDASGLTLMPGIIDIHVHFREPGLTHKGDIASESKAAAAGGITSFMDMPNTIPQTISAKAAEQKLILMQEKSLVNYAVYAGVTSDNIDELLEIDPSIICGIKLFMGSSTGGMLVNEKEIIEKLFRKCKNIISVHCEDEEIINKNLRIYKEKYGDNIPFTAHPDIRSAEACYASSSLAVNMAERFGTRMHIAHLTTAKELELLKEDNKNITAETCVNYLYFNDTHYESMGAKLKMNPSVKTGLDQEALLKAVKEGKIKCVATDHAPHLWDEKNNPYIGCPSGVPSIQHSLPMMLELHKQGKISLENITESMCHAPATVFNIKKRGFIRKGYMADMVLIDTNKKQKAETHSLFYKCGWSPVAGTTFSSTVIHTIVNGTIVYSNGMFNEKVKGRHIITGI